MAGQGQQSTGFDPNAMSFGSGINTQKSFGTLAGQNSNNSLFTLQVQGQQQNQPAQSNIFGNLGGNNNATNAYGNNVFTNAFANTAPTNNFSQPANNNSQQNFGGNAGTGGANNTWMSNTGNFGGNNNIYKN
jgi:hypothetical protein